MKYQAFGPDAEVYGQAMLAFVESVNYDNFRETLARHDLTEIIPNKWYPQQIWLDVFTDIAHDKGSVSDLVSIGVKIAETAVLPPEATGLSFMDMMLAFNEGSYLAHNRGKDIGGIEAQIINETHIVMIDKTPYPDYFVFGAYWGMARRFLPHGTHATVKFDESTPRRDEGGDATLVHIVW